MNDVKHIVYFTSTRADFGICKDLLKIIDNESNFKLTILTCNAHLSRFQDGSLDEILECKFKNVIILNDEVQNVDLSSLIENYSKLVNLIGSQLNLLSPDFLLILGDRYETHACASVATLLKIPIIHIHGGEESKGSIDNKFRNSISMLSDYHLAANETSMNKLIKMGSNHVSNIGSLSLSNVSEMEFLSKEEIIQKFNLPNHLKLGILTLHPETNKSDVYNFKLIDETINFLKNEKTFFIITSSNQDHLGSEFNKIFKSYCKENPEKALFVPSLGKLLYFSILKNFDYIVGNSSSGIIEAPFFPIKIYNIGLRQDGRTFSKKIVNIKIENLKGLKLDKENKHEILDIDFKPANLDYVLKLINSFEIYKAQHE